jgi:folylpolyglutamate synthase/dihydropteroate synthase
VERIQRQNRDTIRKIPAGITRYHLDKSREEAKLQREEDKQRLDALKVCTLQSLALDAAHNATSVAYDGVRKSIQNNDFTAYQELVKRSKDERMKQLLEQTDSYLTRIGAIVQANRQSLQPEDVAGAGAQPEENTDDQGQSYYKIAHNISEEITEQPKMLNPHKRLNDYQVCQQVYSLAHSLTHSLTH